MTSKVFCFFLGGGRVGTVFEPMQPYSWLHRPSNGARETFVITGASWHTNQVALLKANDNRTFMNTLGREVCSGLSKVIFIRHHTVP